MASQTTAFNEDSQFTVSSILSTALAIIVLDQIDDKLEEIGPQAEETLADNGKQPQQAPR
jgi:beta-lactamase class A